MKIEEAIVYVLASYGHGMKTEQIAREINERGLSTKCLLWKDIAEYANRILKQFEP